MNVYERGKIDICGDQTSLLKNGAVGSMGSVRAGRGSCFPQVNCMPCVHNLLILPFCWRITPKESQYSLFRVLEMSSWLILSLTAMEIVILLSISIHESLKDSCLSQNTWLSITLVSFLLEVNWYNTRWLHSFSSQSDLLWSMPMASSPHMCGWLSEPHTPKIMAPTTQSTSQIHLNFCRESLLLKIKG